MNEITNYNENNKLNNVHIHTQIHKQKRIITQKER